MIVMPAGVGLVKPAGGSAVTYAKWSLVGDGTTLSNGGLTAVRNGSGSTWNTVIADRDFTGKHYWECQVTWPATGERQRMGICGAGATLSAASDRIGQSVPATTWGAAVGGPNNITRSSGSFANRADSSTGVVETYMFAYDASSGAFWVGTIALGWFGSAPPGGSTYVLPAGTYRPALSLGSAYPESITANFGQSAFVGTVPTGFDAGLFG